jgi:hypothetical protein
MHRLVPSAASVTPGGRVAALFSDSDRDAEGASPPHNLSGHRTAGDRHLWKQGNPSVTTGRLAEELAVDDGQGSEAPMTEGETGFARFGHMSSVRSAASWSGARTREARFHRAEVDL